MEGKRAPQLVKLAMVCLLLIGVLEVGADALAVDLDKVDCAGTEYVSEPTTGYDSQYCVKAGATYKSIEVAAGAYVALKHTGDFPYSFEAGVGVGPSTDMQLTVNIGADLTNDDTNGICLNPYVRLRTPKIKLPETSWTLQDEKDTLRKNLFGPDSLFGGPKMCVPEGKLKWCLRQTDTTVEKIMGLAGAEACLSLESYIMTNKGGAFKLMFDMALFNSTVFRSAVEKECSKSNNYGICKLECGLTCGSDLDFDGKPWVQDSINNIVDGWEKLRSLVLGKDNKGYHKSINLGKLVKELLAKQQADAQGPGGRRRLAGDAIKDDGTMCFGEGCNKETAANIASAPALLALPFSLLVFAL